MKSRTATRSLTALASLSMFFGSLAQGSPLGIDILNNATRAIGAATESPRLQPSTVQQQPGNPVDRQAQLQGTWATQCEVNPAGEGSAGSVLVISNNTYRQISGLFTNSQCAAPVAFTVTDEGTFTLGAEASPGAYQIDQITARAVVAARTAAGAQILNSVALCGITDWTVGAERDITPLIQSGQCGSATLGFYSIYRVQGNTLQIALPTEGPRDATAADRRPADFTEYVSFTKQPPTTPSSP